MTQELIELRFSILEGRYADALSIVDELEGMSKKAILLQFIATKLTILLPLNMEVTKLRKIWLYCQK